MSLIPVLQRLISGQDLDAAQMRTMMKEILQGRASPAQIGAALATLRLKGETATEIASAAEVLREFATRVQLTDTRHLVDTCGSGGDGAGIFNVSTAAALVAAAAGARVAKHGNRAVSSASGSADVLEQAGIRLELRPEQVAACIERIGIGFLFAPRHHEAMRHAAAPRRELGTYSFLNLLGPLSNPAGAECQLTGVYDDALLETVIEALQRLGCRHALVVHSEDGLDEISCAAPTRAIELREGKQQQYCIDPRELGLEGKLDGLQAADPKASLNLIRSVLDAKPGAHRNIVILNAGAALYVAGVSADLRQGTQQARQAIDSGAARAKLEEFRTFSQSLP